MRADFCTVQTYLPYAKIRAGTTLALAIEFRPAFSFSSISLSLSPFLSSLFYSLHLLISRRRRPSRMVVLVVVGLLLAISPLSSATDEWSSYHTHEQLTRKLIDINEKCPDVSDYHRFSPNRLPYPS